MESVTHGYRIRAYPNGAQRRLLERWSGATRWLWNTALEIRSEAYRACGLGSMSDSGSARNVGSATIATSMPHGICWRKVFASLPVVMTGTCAWTRGMHAQMKIECQ